MDTRIELVLSLIARNIHAKQEPRVMATHVKLSVSRFYDLFREQTGTVPARYIRELRLKMARDLLLNSHLSVKEIAGRVGIQDVSHFVRDFEKRYGLSPRRLRRQLCAIALLEPLTAPPVPENSPTNRKCGQLDSMATH